MAAKKANKIDGKGFLIVVLSLIVCVETVLLYKSNPDQFVGFFYHKKSAAQARPLKKTPVKPAPLETLRPASSVEEASTQAPSSIPVPAAVMPAPAGKPKVVIILDDWGYSTKNCQYLREIKEPLTVAVLPDLPHSNDVMQCAHESGKELMLHLPMEPHNNTDPYPPDYVLKTAMSPIKVDRLLSNILDKMPLIDGVNNHMGSKATEDRRLMTTIFRQLKSRKLFYVDSRTASKSVCATVAKEMNLPFASRDVFLDNVNERSAITTQLNTLARIAKKRGWAVAIGHDRSLTLQVIQERLPWFKEQGFELITVKNLISQ
jgi:polysaccharide deacetylase 2 family uncharacterized protein YibQ